MFYESQTFVQKVNCRKNIRCKALFLILWISKFALLLKEWKILFSKLKQMILEKRKKNIVNRKIRSIIKKTHHFYYGHKIKSTIIINLKSICCRKVLICIKWDHFLQSECLSHEKNFHYFIASVFFLLKCFNLIY